MTDFLVIIVEVEIAIIVIGGFMLIVRHLRTQPVQVSGFHKRRSIRREPFLVPENEAVNSNYAKYDRIQKE